MKMVGWTCMERRQKGVAIGRTFTLFSQLSKEGMQAPLSPIDSEAAVPILRFPGFPVSGPPG